MDFFCFFINVLILGIFGIREIHRRFIKEFNFSITKSIRLEYTCCEWNLVVTKFVLCESKFGSESCQIIEFTKHCCVDKVLETMPEANSGFSYRDVDPLGGVPT